MGRNRNADKHHFPCGEGMPEVQDLHTITTKSHIPFTAF